jgi:excisionase family DNA binding protein
LKLLSFLDAANGIPRAWASVLSVSRRDAIEEETDMTNSSHDAPSRSSGLAGVFLTIQEVAGRWKTSPRNVHRKIADGSLPVHRIGRLVRIALSDIVLFEAQSRMSA